MPELFSCTSLKFTALGLSLLGVSCSLSDSGKACTTELRNSPCITINGSDSIDSKYSVYRSASGSIVKANEYGSQRCFYEKTGPITVFVMLGDSLVAQKNVTIKKSADGCHAERTIVNFDIPE